LNVRFASAATGISVVGIADLASNYYQRPSTALAKLVKTSAGNRRQTAHFAGIDML
jgi:hypothetical protein